MGRDAAVRRDTAPVDGDLLLPLTVALRYLFFLSRRPISGANRHFLSERTAGLRALASTVADGGDARLDEVAAELRRLTPATLVDVTRTLSRLLTPLVPKDTADDVFVTRRPVARDWLASVRRIRLVLGPSIGIGDETIALAVPAWLRTAAVDARIDVLSTRPELWTAVTGPSSVALYTDYTAVLDALRDDADTVMLVDFERPALAASLSRSAPAIRYVELSLGARTLDVFDGPARTLHVLSPPAPLLTNYYEFVVDAMRALGATASLEGRVAAVGLTATPREAAPVPTVVVSPFTSKYEPSPSAWSTLLGALFPRGATQNVRLRFDPGPSLSTERFASTLVAATRAVVGPGVQCELASEAPARTLSLPGVLDLVRSADVVVCADTFAAHVAPLGGCTTLVVANQALTPWRVPRAPVFYFDDEDPPEAIGRAMRRIVAVSRVGDGRGRAPWAPPNGLRLCQITDALAEALTRTDVDAAELAAQYQSCAAEMRQFVSGLPDWPADFGAVLTDRAYHRLLPPLPPQAAMATSRESGNDLVEHIDHLLSPWRNSNLCKYFALASNTEDQRS
jgi:hypothetical protein